MDIRVVSVVPYPVENPVNFRSYSDSPWMRRLAGGTEPDLVFVYFLKLSNTLAIKVIVIRTNYVSAANMYMCGRSSCLQRLVQFPAVNLRYMVSLKSNQVGRMDKFVPIVRVAAFMFAAFQVPQRLRVFAICLALPTLKQQKDWILRGSAIHDG